MAKPNLKLVPPPIDIHQVQRSTPTRKPNAAYRSREYLTPTEMDAIMEAARKMRHGHRDSTMLLIAYRHGFRAAEICDLRWDQIDLDQARLHVKRVKRGMPSVHPIAGEELRALRRLKRESAAHSDFRLRVGKERTVLDGRLREAGGTCRQGGGAWLQMPSTHASTRMRLQARQRGARHPRPSTVSRS
jgi:integrase